MIFCIAERFADRFEIHCDAVGPDERKQVAGVRAAIVGDSPRGVIELALFGGVVGFRVDVSEGGHGLVAAVDGSALADATRIESDDVEPIEHLVGEAGLPHKMTIRRRRDRPG